MLDHNYYFLVSVLFDLRGRVSEGEERRGKRD